MRPSESGHWYARDGTPMYQIRGKDGSMRPCTLRDARKLGLYPGVTTIIKCAAAPQLETWKQEQVLLSALTLPRLPGESDKDFCARVMQDSQEQGRKARDRGTEIHGAIQGHYEGQPPAEDLWPFVQGVTEALKANFGERQWVPEKPIAHPLGYGTKSDLHEPKTVLLDFKGKDFTKADLHTLKTYDEHDMQLAATAAALREWEECAIVYFSRTDPGLCKVCYIEPADIARGWEMFKALLEYWQAKNKYRPAQWVEAEAA